MKGFIEEYGLIILIVVVILVMLTCSKIGFAGPLGDNINAIIDDLFKTGNSYVKDAKQTEKAYRTVLYDDGTFIMNELKSQSKQNEKEHGSVIATYKTLEEDKYHYDYPYDDDMDVPWYEEMNLIKRVEIGSKMQPTNTSYWFSDARHMEYGDFTNLDTSNVEDMSYMFNYAGCYSSQFTLDLTGWDTSNVEDMSYMFKRSGSTAFLEESLSPLSTELYEYHLNGLSTWDTSNVKNMSYMFEQAGHSTDKFSLDISNWNTSNVTNMRGMFWEAGWFATLWSVDLSAWNVSNVTNMSDMFNHAGYAATLWSVGDLSAWNVSNVTNMDSMFSRAGYHTKNWSVGNLTKWDVSNVSKSPYSSDYPFNGHTSYPYQPVWNW